MKRGEAIIILEDKLNEYRELPYSELVEKIGEQEIFEGKIESGEDYQIEFDFFYDDFEARTLRVLGMLSYSFWTGFSPATSDFIIAADEKFVGE